MSIKLNRGVNVSDVNEKFVSFCFVELEFYKHIHTHTNERLLKESYEVQR